MVTSEGIFVANVSMASFPSAFRTAAHPETLSRPVIMKWRPIPPEEYTMKVLLHVVPQPLIQRTHVSPIPSTCCKLGDGRQAFLPSQIQPLFRTSSYQHVSDFLSGDSSQNVVGNRSCAVVLDFDSKPKATLHFFLLRTHFREKTVTALLWPGKELPYFTGKLKVFTSESVTPHLLSLSLFPETRSPG